MTWATNVSERMEEQSYNTPFLDNLAQGGMRFEHAHSQAHLHTKSGYKNHNRHIEPPQLYQMWSSRPERQHLRQPNKEGWLQDMHRWEMAIERRSS